MPTERRAWRLLAALGLLSVTVAPSAAAGPASDLVVHSPGTLPLVLTVPHDGDQPIGFTPPRRQGAVLRDIHTRALAERLADALAQRLGARPCVVIARFSRRFADANRSQGEAVESDSALPAWQAYHAAVAQCVADARSRHPEGALLLDIHGQGQEPEVLFRGTRAGQTTRALLARHGAAALQGPASLIGQLASRGYTVHPAIDSSSMREDPRFAGGYTVATYGSHQPGGIDAIQLEFGLQQRLQPGLADDLADAVAAVLQQQGLVPAR